MVEGSFAPNPDRNIARPHYPTSAKSGFLTDDYIEWANSVVAGLRGTSPWLEQEFDDVVDRAARSLVPPKADV